MNADEKTNLLAVLAAAAREELGEPRPGDDTLLEGIDRPNVHRVATEEFETIAEGPSATDEALLNRLLGGAASAAERADLERRGAGSGQLQRGIRLFTPLSAQEQDALADQLSAHLAREPALSASAPAKPNLQPGRARAAAVRAEVQAPWWQRWGWALAGLATAGAAAWLLVPRASQSDHQLASNAPQVRESAAGPLPDYQANPSGGIQLVRGGQGERAEGEAAGREPAEREPAGRESAGREPAAALQPAQVSPAAVQRLNPDSVLQVDLRPAIDVKGDVELRGFVSPLGADGAVGGPPESVTVAAEFAAGSGAARVRAPAAQTFGARRGRWRLYLVVGRPAILAASAPALAVGAPVRGEGWVRLAVDIDLVAGD